MDSSEENTYVTHRFSGSRVVAWVRDNVFSITLVILTFSMLTMIELRHPFYFLRDDNLHYSLPYYVHNYRSILAGEFPLFNFHQYLGTPALSCIQPAAFYLPNYVAVLLSKAVFGDYNWTMEFIAAFHLVLAALGFYNLMRQFRLAEWSCFFGAIAWTFCSFTIAAGNSWIQIVAYAAYLPWLIVFSLRMANSISVRIFIILTVLRLFAVLVGASFIVYVVAFEIIVVLTVYVIKYKIELTVKRVTNYMLVQALSYIAVILLALPLILPALHQLDISAFRNLPFSIEKYTHGSYRFIIWLNGLLTPLSDKYSSISDQYYYWPNQQFLSHVGWLTLLFCVIALWSNRDNRIFVLSFFVIAVFSYLWSSNSFITKLFYYIPVFNRQRLPFKLVFFTNFCIIIVATFGFDVFYVKIKNLFKDNTKVFRTIVIVALLFHFSNFAIIHLDAIQRTFFYNRTQIPPSDEPLRDTLSDGRIVSIVYGGVNPYSLVDSTRHFGYNYATLYQLNHFGGYETLVASSNLDASLKLYIDSYILVDETIDFENSKLKYYRTSSAFNYSTQDFDYFRKWGVKWYILDKKVKIINAGKLRIVNNDDDRTVLYDPEAKPLVSWYDTRGENGITYRFTTNSVIIKTLRESSSNIIVNVLYNPFFEATLDGRKVGIFKTGDSQMIMNVPPGPHEINITYSDPYFYKGLYISCAILAFAFVGLAYYRFKVCKVESETAGCL